jgi:hypothetical protein
MGLQVIRFRCIQGRRHWEDPGHAPTFLEGEGGISFGHPTVEVEKKGPRAKRARWETFARKKEEKTFARASLNGPGMGHHEDCEVPEADY